ncbi:MAG: protein kinase [Planctomycetota bacterium]
MSHSSDRNLLVGILALQMDFVSQGDLIAAMHDWVADKSQTIDDIFCKRSVLTEDVRTLLVALVDKHIELHGNDVHQSLASVDSPDGAFTLSSVLDDTELTQSLAALVSGGRAADETTVPASDSASSINERFKVLRPHAKGGLGQVLVALDQDLNREVALKEIQERFASNPNYQLRFLAEAKITGGLEHPGVVPIYGLGKYADGRPFYAMRFIKGESLREAIDNFHGKGSAPDDHPTMEFRQLLGRFVDVCNAVDYAHSRGVLHRDLKPGNVMLGKYGETLVVDWGLAKVIGRDDELSGDEPTLRPAEASDSASTLQGQALGTPGFMSPEQAAGKHNSLGPASDVYSLGATLYYVLTGRVPFKDGTGRELLPRIIKGDFSSPREIVPTLPRALEAITLKAMALEPNDRYSSPGRLAEDVELYLADEPVSACAEPFSVVARRWLVKHRTLVAVAASILLITSLIGPVVAYQQMQLAKRSQELVDSERDKRVQQERLAREQAKTALQQAKLATQERANAQQQAKLRGRADEQRKLAESKRREAEQAEKLATESNFSGQLQLASSLIDDGSYGDAERVLRTTRRDLRGWCFNHLKARLDDEFSQVLIGKKQRITNVSASPDGRYFLIAASDNRNVRVELWDAKNRRKVRSIGEFESGRFRVIRRDKKGKRIPDVKPKSKTVTCSSFNPTGVLFATGGMDGVVRVFKTVSGELVDDFDHGSSVYSVDFAPSDGDPADDTRADSTPADYTLASIGNDGVCRIWTPGGQEPSETLGSHSTVLTDMSFDSSGRLIAIAGVDGDIRIWNVSTGQLVRTLQGESLPMNVIAFSSDGNRLVSTLADGGAQIWNVRTGDPLHQLHFPDRLISSLQWAKDGSRILGAGDQLTVEWDTSTGDVLRSIPIPTGIVTSATYMRDDSEILVGGLEGRAFVVAAGPSAIRRKTDLGSTVNVSDVSDDGKTVAVGLESGRVVLMDLIDHNVIAEYQCDSPVLSVKFSASDKNLVVGTQRSGIWLLDGQTLESQNHIESSEEMSFVGFSPNGSRLLGYRTFINAGGSARHVPFVMETSSGKLLFELDLNPSKRRVASQPISIQLPCLTFNHSGSLIAGCVGKSIYLWDANTGDFLFRVTGIHGASTTLEFSPDDRYLVRGTLGVVSTPGPTEIPGDLAMVRMPIADAIRELNESGVLPRFDDVLRLKGHPDRIQSAVFSPDGLSIASAGWDGSIRLWNAESGVSRLQLSTSPHGLRTLHFSEDGSKLVCIKRAMGSTDRTNFPIRIYDLQSAELKWKLPGCFQRVKRLVFAKNHERLATFSDGRLVEVWELTTGKKRLIKHVDSEVVSMVFSPDCQSLAYSSKDGKLWICEIEQERHYQVSGPEPIRRLAWADDTVIHCQCADKRVRAFDVANKQWAKAVAEVEEASFSEGPPSSFEVEIQPIRGDKKFSHHNEILVRNQTNDLLHRFHATNSAATAWTIDPAGKFIAISDYSPRARDGTEIETYVWSAREPESLAYIGQEKDVRAVEHSSDGSKLFGGGTDRKICVWDTRSGISQLQYRRLPVVGLSVHPNNTSFVHQDSNDRLFLVDASRRTELGMPEIDQIYGKSDASFTMLTFGMSSYRRKFLDFDSSGDRIAFGVNKDVVLSYPALIPMSVTLGSQDSKVDGAFFRPSDQAVLSFGDDGIYVWNSTSGELLQRRRTIDLLDVEQNARTEIQTVGVSKVTGKVFLAIRSRTSVDGSYSTTVTIVTLRLDDLQREHSFVFDLPFVTSIAGSADGNFISVGGANSSVNVDAPGEVVLFRASDGSEAARFDDDIGLVTSQSFHPKQAELAIGTLDGQVRVWKYERSVVDARTAGSKRLADD